MKTVLIGAGSRSFGLGQITDLLRAEELHGRGLTLVLVLVDEGESALDLMRRLACRIRDRRVFSEAGCFSPARRWPGRWYPVAGTPEHSARSWVLALNAPRWFRLAATRPPGSSKSKADYVLRRCACPSLGARIALEPAN